MKIGQILDHLSTNFVNYLTDFDGTFPRVFLLHFCFVFSFQVRQSDVYRRFLASSLIQEHGRPKTLAMKTVLMEEILVPETKLLDSQSLSKEESKEWVEYMVLLWKRLERLDKKYKRMNKAKREECLEGNFDLLVSPEEFPRLKDLFERKDSGA